MTVSVRCSVDTCHSADALAAAIAAAAARILCHLHPTVAITKGHLTLLTNSNVIMAAEWNTASHYIFALWLLSIFLLSVFFPRLISAFGDWMCTIFPHMVWP